MLLCVWVSGIREDNRYLFNFLELSELYRTLSDFFELYRTFSDFPVIEELERTDKPIYQRRLNMSSETAFIFVLRGFDTKGGKVIAKEKKTALKENLLKIIKSFTDSYLINENAYICKHRQRVSHKLNL